MMKDVTSIANPGTMITWTLA